MSQRPLDTFWLCIFICTSRYVDKFMPYHFSTSSKKSRIYERNCVFPYCAGSQSKYPSRGYRVSDITALVTPPALQFLPRLERGFFRRSRQTDNCRRSFCRFRLEYAFLFIYFYCFFIQMLFAIIFFPPI
jgi:hypothetical protein